MTHQITAVHKFIDGERKDIHQLFSERITRKTVTVKHRGNLKYYVVNIIT